MSMEIPPILKAFTGFIDGVGQTGKVTEIKLPSLVLQTEEYQAGGMLAPLDVPVGGLEKLDCEMSFETHSATVMAHLNQPGLSFTARASQESPTETQAIIVQMTGLMKEIDPGSFKPKSKGEKKVVFNASAMKIKIADKDVLDFDAVNRVWKQNGKDMLAAQNKALGL